MQTLLKSSLRAKTRKISPITRKNRSLLTLKRKRKKKSQKRLNTSKYP